LPSLEASRSIDDVGRRIKTLFLGRDGVGAFLRDTLGAALLYTARVAPAIAHSIDDVDRAMQWGFGWELGPFEIWDAIGIQEVLAAAGDIARPVQGRDVGDPKRVALQEAALHTVDLPERFRNDGVPPAGPELQIL